MNSGIKGSISEILSNSEKRERPPPPSIMAGSAGDLLGTELAKKMQDNGALETELLATLLSADEMGFAAGE